MPTDEQLDEFRKAFVKLGDELQSKTSLKAGRGKPVNVKIRVYLQKQTNATDPKKLTYMQWVNFFSKVNTMKLTPEGLNQLASDIEEANK